MNYFKYLIFFSLLIGTNALAQSRIVAIDVEGNSRVDDSAVLLQVSSEVGTEADAVEIESDVKNIYRTGFFEQVIAKQLPAKGGFKLVFVVVEKPAIREVKVEGNKEISTSTFLEKANLSERRFLDNRKINAGIEEVKKYYATQGFYGTEISLVVNPVENNQVDLLFNVTEGIEQVIREVKWEGNKSLNEGELSKSIKTSRYKWWSSWITGTGVVKKEDLEADVKEITHLYLTKGYVDVRVGEPVVQNVKDGLRVVFSIQEGERYKVGKISAQGTLFENSEEKTLKGISLKSNDIFNVDTLREDTFKVSDKFTDIGYAFANVDPLTKINRDQKTVDISYNISKGNLITVNKIIFSGNAKTNDNVIRRTLKFTERELFSSSKIRRSQELLQRLGYFEEVAIAPEKTQEQDEVNIGVTVREAATGSFSAGAGVSSGDGFIISGRVAENNVFGTGNSLSLDIDTGDRRRNYVLSFENPRINDSKWSGGMDILSTEREFSEFDRNQVGGSINVGHPISFFGKEYEDDLKFNLGYELMQINIDNVDKRAPELIREERGKSVASSVIPRITRNTIDNPIDPSRGSRQVLRIELAGLGGDERYWLSEISNTLYYTLFNTSVGSIVFSNRVRLGYGETFNNDDFPLFKRFFPGGINSVRGFDARELGPKDEDGNEFGGNKQLVGNFELIYPIVNSVGLKGVVFYDVGNAFDDEDNISIGDLRHAVGWGIRWRSPIAPIRFEVGYPLDRESGEGAVATHFSFGSPL